MKQELLKPFVQLAEDLKSRLHSDPEFWCSDEYNESEDSIHQAIASYIEDDEEDYLEKATAEERLDLYIKVISRIR